MKQVTLRFPDKISFERFMKYISIPKCNYNIEKLTISCDYDEMYVRIAKDIFKAEIVED